MDLKEADVIAVCATYRTMAKRMMLDANALAGARDLVRLTASASMMEWAAGDLARVAGIALPDARAILTTCVPTGGSNVIHLVSSKSGIPLSINVTYIYRAHVEPAPDSTYPERMAYVWAIDEDTARRQIVRVLSAIEFVDGEQAAERVSDCQGATRLIKQGVSHDRLSRLFEVGQKSGALQFVRHPLFLLREPAALALKWAEIMRELPLPSGDAP